MHWFSTIFGPVSQYLLSKSVLILLSRFILWLSDCTLCAISDSCLCIILLVCKFIGPIHLTGSVDDQMCCLRATENWPHSHLICKYILKWSKFAVSSPSVRQLAEELITSLLITFIRGKKSRGQKVKVLPYLYSIHSKKWIIEWWLSIIENTWW